MLSFSCVLLECIPFSQFPQGFKLQDLFYCGITPPVGLQIYNKKVLDFGSPYNDSIVSGVDHDLWINLLSINPSVTINSLPIELCSVSTGNSKTSNYHDRHIYIQRSFMHWAPILTESLGQAFFNHFYMSYRQSLDDLLYSSLLKGKFNHIFEFRPYNFFFWCLRRVFAKINHSKMFPPFKE